MATSNISFCSLTNVAQFSISLGYLITLSLFFQVGVDQN